MASPRAPAFIREDKQLQRQLGQNIKDLGAAEGMTQGQLADLLDFGHGNYVNRMVNERTTITPQTVQKLLNHFPEKRELILRGLSEDQVSKLSLTNSTVGHAYILGNNNKNNTINAGSADAETKTIDSFLEEYGVLLTKQAKAELRRAKEQWRGSKQQDSVWLKTALCGLGRSGDAKKGGQQGGAQQG